MPDIAMCVNENCKLRYKCYRFMATPTPMRQSYADFKPKSDKECKNFLEIWKR